MEQTSGAVRKEAYHGVGTKGEQEGWGEHGGIQLYRYGGVAVEGWRMEIGLFLKLIVELLQHAEVCVRVCVR